MSALIRLIEDGWFDGHRINVDKITDKQIDDLYRFGKVEIAHRGRRYWLYVNREVEIKDLGFDDFKLREICE